MLFEKKEKKVNTKDCNIYTAFQVLLFVVVVPFDQKQEFCQKKKTKQKKNSDLTSDVTHSEISAVVVCVLSSTFILLPTVDAML